jgi:hypothetical protein
MTEAVNYPEPVFPEEVLQRDPSTLPAVFCGKMEPHELHVWIGAWTHGDEHPRRCEGLL